MFKKLKAAFRRMKSNGAFKKVATLAMSLMLVFCSCVMAFAADVSEGTTPVSYSDFSSIFTALQEQISVGTIVGVLGAVVGACIGLVFMWWGVRKVVSMLMAAFRKGRISV